MTNDTFRGYPIKQRGDGVYIFVDNSEPVAETWTDRPCGECGLPNTSKDFDACIGEITGAMNACCGHGDEEQAYIQWSDGGWIGGKEALEVMRVKND